MVQRRSKVSGSLLLALCFAALGCTDFSSPPESLGRVTVDLRDESNVGVPQIVVNLWLPGKGTLWRTLRTNSGGVGEFGTADGGIRPGSYVVSAELAGTQYRLATTETNDKPITVVIGETTNVTFSLVRSSVGLP